MENSVQFGASTDRLSARHLCVLVHGLYGQPSHLDSIANALREKYRKEQLLILAAKRNTGTLTYDGIELGGERLAYEIEEAIKEFANQGHIITRLSVLGYSLGGLIARYAIGLLYSRGYFDKIQPVNFATFATPHVGVRSPTRRSHFWNVLGARTISKSGRQLFMIDNFRDTGQPLLSILAAKNSIFMLGLEKFRHRCLYANIVNDRSAVYYTTGISKTDPFFILDNVMVNYVPGYSNVVVDPDNPVLPLNTADMTFWMRMSRCIVSNVSRLPFILFLCIFIPLASLLYLVNAAIQTVRSQRRIRLHQEGKLGVPLSTYKVPVIVEEMRSVVEEMYETVNSTHEPEYLDDCDMKLDEPELQAPSQQCVGPPKSGKAFANSVRSPFASVVNNNSEERRSPEFPTLALTPAQFAIIDNLNSVGFRKYPVHIHNAWHSHAAIIVRKPRKSFAEGKIVIRHWLEEEFHI